MVIGGLHWIGQYASCAGCVTVVVILAITLWMVASLARTLSIATDCLLWGLYAFFLFYFCFFVFLGRLYLLLQS